MGERFGDEGVAKWHQKLQLTGTSKGTVDFAHFE